MKLHQQFDLNLEVLKINNVNEIPKAINEVPVLVEKLIKELLKKGYIVIESTAYYMGVPKNITIIKDFTGPFTTLFSSKIKSDFTDVSRKLGIGKLFE